MLYWITRKLLSKVPSRFIPVKYQLVDVEGSFLSSILITRGIYKGVQFFIGDVRIRDGRLSFKVEYLNNPKKLPLDDDILFTRVSGKILSELMQKAKKTNTPVLVKKEKEVSCDSQSIGS